MDTEWADNEFMWACKVEKMGVHESIKSTQFSKKKVSQSINATFWTSSVSPYKKKIKKQNHLCLFTGNVHSAFHPPGCYIAILVKTETMS